MEPQTYADVQALEEAFINAGDMERAEMLADGKFSPTDRIMPLADQSLARIVLGRPLSGSAQKGK